MRHSERRGSTGLGNPLFVVAICMANPRSGRRSVWTIPVDPVFFTYFRPGEPLYDDLDPEPAEVDDEPSGPVPDRLAVMLTRLHPMDADFLDLYFLRGKFESEIGVIFGLTQAAVSYRLHKAIARLRWLAGVPQITEEELRRDLPTLGFSEQEVEILYWMWKTTCLSEAARQTGATDETTKWRLARLCRLLEKSAQENPVARPYADFFAAVQKRRGMLWHQGRAR